MGGIGKGSHNLREKPGIGVRDRNPAPGRMTADELAAQIEEAVRTRDLGHASSAGAPPMTIRIGLATRRRASDGDPVALLRLAEAQLDQARHQGRAQVSGKVLQGGISG